MPATLEAPPALPRLSLVHRRATRAVLDGAWWPRSWDAPSELSSLAQALSTRYGRNRSIILNGSARAERVKKLSIDDHMVRIGWFASMSPALVIATTDAGDQVDLVIIPPNFADDAAERAMVGAADPANAKHAPDLLADSAGPIQGRATGIDSPEAVWDNEGGFSAPSRTPAPAAPGRSC